MWRFLIVLFCVVGAMDQAKFKNKFKRYLFKHHKTIERLRPVIGRNKNHDKNRKLFESVKKDLEELNLKMDNILTLYEISN